MLTAPWAVALKAWSPRLRGEPHAELRDDADTARAATGERRDELAYTRVNQFVTNAGNNAANSGLAARNLRHVWSSVDASGAFVFTDSIPFSAASLLSYVSLVAITSPFPASK